MRPVQTIEITETPAFLQARALLDERQEPGTLKPGSVERLQKTVQQIHDSLDPQDIDRPLNQGFFRYHNGKAAFALRRPDGSFDNPLSFTSRGLSQFGYRVLGGGGTKFLEKQRQQGEHGRKLAEVNWNHALSLQESPSLLRTVQMPGHAHRTIRASLSGGGRGYSVIDNVDILNLLASAPELRELPVIESHITHDSMRLRLLLNPEDAALFDPATGKVRNPTNHHETVNLPVPMLEIWNGETGNSSVRILDRIYFIQCLNGLGGFGGGGTSYRWNHTGGEDRAEKIKAGMVDALSSARVRASGQIERYKAAQNIAVDSAFDLLDAWGDTGMTQEQRSRTKDAMADETVTPGKKLASLVDAITLAAQKESDKLKQRDLEDFAARILARGLEAAQRNNGRIEVATA